MFLKFYFDFFLHQFNGDVFFTNKIRLCNDIFCDWNRCKLCRFIFKDQKGNIFFLFSKIVNVQCKILKNRESYCWTVCFCINNLKHIVSKLISEMILSLLFYWAIAKFMPYFMDGRNFQFWLHWCFFNNPVFNCIRGGRIYYTPQYILIKIYARNV